MPDQVEILWLSDELASAERCIVRSDPGDGAIVGTAVLPMHGVPAQVAYSVATDTDWSTTSVHVQIDAGRHSRSISMERRDQRWVVDGVSRPDLDDCANVDLGWGPATNTLALRWAPLSVGESAMCAAAWLRFPELDVVPSDQTYTRLAPDRVRYTSPTFTAELHLTPEDVVTTYGAELWRTAALSRMRSDAESVPSERRIPDEVSVVRCTPTWTKHNVPPALLGNHQTSRWAELVVEQGIVAFVEADTGFRAQATPNNTVVIVPDQDHHIAPDDDARFFVRFYDEALE